MKPAAWTDVLQGRGKETLERELLPAWLPGCRWFGGKGRAILKTTILDRVLPPAGGPDASKGDAGDLWALAFARIDYADGPPDQYLLPLAWAQGAAAEAVRDEAPGAVLTTLMDGSILFDAVYHPGFRSAMRRMIATGACRHGLSGILRGHARPDAFAGIPTQGVDESKILAAEQSNTAVIFPGRHFIKFLRRLEAGENPELEFLRFFDEHTSFRNVPPYAGHLEYISGAGATWSLAIAEGLVPNQGDAWTHTLKLAGAYWDRIIKPAAKAASDEPLDDRARAFAALLGRRTAEMHLALASRPDIPAFAPEPFSLPYQRSLYQGMRDHSALVFERLSGTLAKLPPERAELGRKVLVGRDKAMAAYAGLLDRLIPTVRIRVHGDYHLGQVLIAGDDVIILDFEGEPARPLDERKLKGSPWRDVAGMLRSFHYAIHSAAPKVGLNPDERPGFEARAELWPQAMADAFLEAYLTAAKGASFVPSEQDREALLRAHLMEKAVYELGYELNNRPDWAHIPMTGILRLI